VVLPDPDANLGSLTKGRHGDYRRVIRVIASGGDCSVTSASGKALFHGPGAVTGGVSLTLSGLCGFASAGQSVSFVSDGASYHSWAVSCGVAAPAPALPPSHPPSTPVLPLVMTLEICSASEMSSAGTAEVVLFSSSPSRPIVLQSLTRAATYGPFPITAAAPIAQISIMVSLSTDDFCLLRPTINGWTMYDGPSLQWFGSNNGMVTSFTWSSFTASTRHTLEFTVCDVDGADTSLKVLVVPGGVQALAAGDVDQPGDVTSITLSSSSAAEHKHLTFVNTGSDDMCIRTPHLGRVQADNFEDSYAVVLDADAGASGGAFPSVNYATYSISASPDTVENFSPPPITPPPASPPFMCSCMTCGTSGAHNAGEEFTCFAPTAACSATGTGDQYATCYNDCPEAGKACECGSRQCIWMR